MSKGLEKIKQRNEAARFGVVIYDGVEPIDIGGTTGVISMARRVLPSISAVTIAASAGHVRLAGDLVVVADHGFDDAPACDRLIVCGGPGWRQQVADAGMLAFLRERPRTCVASVCTGALILAAAGMLDGRVATTRRSAVGTETTAPLASLNAYSNRMEAVAAAVVDDGGVVTGGGVSLAIDATLYMIGDIYGENARDEVSRVIEYDRAFAANKAALGHVVTARGP